MKTIAEKLKDDIDCPNRYTILSDDVFPLSGEGCVVTGIVKGGTITVRDRIWILKPDGTSFQSRAEVIGAFADDFIRTSYKAEENIRVGIFLKGLGESEIAPGSVVTNIEPNIDNADSPFDNPRLKGLLAGRRDALLEDVDRIIQKLVQSDEKFLAAVAFEGYPKDNGDGTAIFQEKSVMRFPYLTAPDGQSFQPVFTDKWEMSNWNPEQEGLSGMFIAGKADIQALLRQSDELKGVVVNPFTDNLIIGKEALI